MRHATGWLRFVLIVLAINAGVISAFLALKARRLPQQPAITQVQAATFARLEDAIAAIDSAAPLPAATLPLVGCRSDCRGPYLLVRAAIGNAIQPRVDHAVYVQFFNESLRVFVNGHAYGPDWLGPPVALRRHWPVLATFPSDALKPEGNEVWLLLYASHDSQIVMPFYFGTQATLRPHYVMARWLGPLGHQVAALIVLAAALMAGAMVLTARRDPVYFWFAVVAIGGLAMLTNSIWPRLPFPTGFNVWLYFLGAFACVCFAPRFADAVLHETTPRFSRWLGYWFFGAVLFAAVLWWLPGLEFRQRNLWPAILLRYTALVVAPYLAWRLLSYARDLASDRFAPWVVGWLVLAVLCAAYDALKSTLMFGMWEVSTAAFGCFFMAVAFVFEVARRVDTNERRMRGYVAELESAVAEREGALRANYQRMQLIAREETLMQERQRLMQDMHDGVAGRLASLLGMPETRAPDAATLRAAVSESLADLRLIIESLNQMDDDLVLAVSRLRPRLQAQLALSGIRLDWQIDPSLRLQGFGPEAVLQVYRIVQEAISNAARHSGAQVVQLVLRQDEAGAVLLISDDGRGFGDSRPGIGVRSMAQRASAIGAHLNRRERNGGGAEIELRFERA